MDFEESTLVLSSDNKETGILTDAQRQLFEIINVAFLSCIISLFGIIGNIINVIIFLTEGFSNTVNISFFGMAISDMCCLITLLWITLCMNPLVLNAGVSWVLMDFEYLTGAWPHIISGRITSYITVYITAERCLCILVPLKVKQMITPPRTAVIICLIYVLNIATLIPEYSITYLDWKWFPELNRSLLSIYVVSNIKFLSGLTYFMNSITGIISFLAVTVFTVILAIQLTKMSKLRQELTAGSKCMIVREKRTVKMIVIIATVLIVCYTPGTTFAFTTFVVPDFALKKRFVNLGFAMWSLGFVLQAFNSSVNIVLYYKMSSKYRGNFHQLFGLNGKKDRFMMNRDVKLGAE